MAGDDYHDKSNTCHDCLPLGFLGLCLVLGFSEFTSCLGLPLSLSEVMASDGKYNRGLTPQHKRLAKWSPGCLVVPPLRSVSEDGTSLAIATSWTSSGWNACLSMDYDGGCTRASRGG
jgi:hypothetical protein